MNVQSRRLDIFRGQLGEFPAIGYARSMQDHSDEHLMSAYAGGEAKAFDELYRRYRGPLYRYLLRQVRNPALANDLYQGAWEKVIRGRDGFRASRSFRAWLFRIAHNHLVDHFRRDRPTEDIADRMIESNEPGPSESASETEKRSRFMAALNALPDEQRDALLLKIESGLALDEIALVTGVPGETVKSRLRYASRKLKQALS